MSPEILSLLTFVSFLMISISAASLLSDLFLRDRARVSRRLKEEFQQEQKDKIRKSLLFKDMRDFKSIDLDTLVEPRPSLRVRCERMLEQSGLNWTLHTLLLLTTTAAIIGAMPGALIQGSILFALLGAAACGVGPLLYVRAKRSSRLEALRSQLPEAYDLMARGLRAGQTIGMTMQGVSEEFPQPIAGEFAYCYEQQNLGLAPDVSLRDLSRRTSIMEINIFVVALIIQKEVGGNLAEMLEKLASIVRDRAKMRGTIQTLTAEGKMQAGLLMALPPGMFAAMLVFNREYAVVLFEYPLLLVGVLVSMGIGALWIRRIINFDF